MIPEADIQAAPDIIVHLSPNDVTKHQEESEKISKVVGRSKSVIGLGCYPKDCEVNEAVQDETDEARIEFIPVVEVVDEACCFLGCLWGRGQRQSKRRSSAEVSHVVQCVP